MEVKKSFLKRKLKGFLSFIVYRYLLALLALTGKNRPGKVEKRSVTIVFMAALGDFLVMCSAVDALAKQGYKITLICKESAVNREIVKETGLFQNVVFLKDGLVSRVKNLGILRGIRTELVVALPLGRHILPDLYMLAVRAHRRLAPDTMLDCGSEQLKKLVDGRVDDLIPVTKTLELERYQEFFARADLFEQELFPYALPKQWENPKRKRLAVFPGAGGGREKCWPPERFAQVIELMLTQKRVDEVLLLGAGQEDEHLAETIFSQLSEQSGVRNLCGQTTISDTLNLIRKSSLVLANDSGSAHMAIASGTPTVVIAGGWQYGRFYPNPRLDPKHRVVIADPSALSCIPCGKSRPDCMGGTGTAKCVCIIDGHQILKNI